MIEKKRKSEGLVSCSLRQTPLPLSFLGDLYPSQHCSFLSTKEEGNCLGAVGTPKQPQWFEIASRTSQGSCWVSGFRERSRFWQQLGQIIGSGVGTELWVVILVLILKQNWQEGSRSSEPFPYQLRVNLTLLFKMSTVPSVSLQHTLYLHTKPVVSSGWVIWGGDVELVHEIWNQDSEIFTIWWVRNIRSTRTQWIVIKLEGGYHSQCLKFLICWELRGLTKYNRPLGYQRRQYTRVQSLFLILSFHVVPTSFQIFKARHHQPLYIIKELHNGKQNFSQCRQSLS